MGDIVTSQFLFLENLPLSGFEGFTTFSTLSGGRRAETSETEFRYSQGGQQAFGFAVTGQGIGLIYEDELLSGGTITQIGIQNSGGGFRGTPILSSDTTYYGVSLTAAQLASETFFKSFLDGDDFIALDLANRDGVVGIQAGSGNDRVVETSNTVRDFRTNPNNLPDLIDLGSGDDVLEITDAIGNFVITTGGGADLIRYTTGLSELGVLERGIPRVTDFDPAEDRIEVLDETGAPRALGRFVDRDGDAVLVAGSGSAQQLDLLVLEGVSVSELTYENGVVTGVTAPAADIFGSVGADVLFGTDARDVIGARGGDDAVDGGGGGDAIDLGAGDDTIDAGSGFEVIALEYGFGIDTVYGFVTGEDRLSVANLGVTAEQVAANSFQTANGYVLDIGLGNVITLVGVTDFDASDLIV